MTSMPYIGAVHVHSDYSHDGRDSLEVIRDTAFARGLQFLGMTEHAEDLTPDIWHEYKQHCAAVSSPEIQVIPGLEFRFAGMRGLHLLALGIEEWGAPATPADFFDLTQNNAIVTVLAHPILARYQIPDVVFDKIDAIEIWNGNYNSRFLPDPKSIEIVQRLRTRRAEVVATVGLDQHDVTTNREQRIVLPEHTSAPLNEIKAGRFENAGHKMTIPAAPKFSESQLRALDRKRSALNMVERAHDIGVQLLHKIGVDR